MIYTVGKEFIKIKETSGTVQNSSSTYTIEMATEPVANSGICIYPAQTVSFHDKTIYLRCLDGASTKVRCVPFEIGSKGVDDDVTYITDGDYLHLTFDFPTGSNKTILLKNPREDLTQADIDAFSELTIEQDIFRNDFAEPTRGIKKALLIKSLPTE